MKIEFENGSVIEGIKSKDSIRGKGWFIGIDLAKEGSDYTVIKCPQCHTIYASDEHYSCSNCGYKFL